MISLVMTTIRHMLPTVHESNPHPPYQSPFVSYLSPYDTLYYMTLFTTLGGSIGGSSMSRHDDQTQQINTSTKSSKGTVTEWVKSVRTCMSCC